MKPAASYNGETDTDAPSATGKPAATGAATASTTGNREATRFPVLQRLDPSLQLCGSGTTGCHGWVHAHPARAYRLGYLVHTGKDPATIPVYYRTGGWQQLHTDGTRHPCPPPENMPTHINIKKGNE